MTAREEQERDEGLVIKPAQAICKIINEAFSEPFMPEGFVEAKAGVDGYGKPKINLRIGARDMSFTLNGKLIGTGTHLASEWFEKVNNLANI